MESILGIHEHALLLREKRSELLASNLANVDTPNYKARDIDFKSALSSKMKISESQPSLATTQNSHIKSIDQQQASNTKYRIPMQDSFDGNTVDSQIEQAKFTENSMQYLASLNFLKGKVNTILMALKGD